MRSLLLNQPHGVIRVGIVLCVCLLTVTPEVWGQEGAGKVENPTGPASWSWLPTEVRDRLATAKKKPWREAADEVLIPRSQVRWPRYLGSLLNTPVWVDLGVSFRTRLFGKGW